MDPKKCHHTTDPNTHTGMSISGNGILHVLVPTYTSTSGTFNLYAFLSSIYIYIIYFLSICILCCQGQDVFYESTRKLWPFSTLKKLHALSVTFKGKFNKGIISLFEDYEDVKVCKLLSFKLF
jgi:hypothetical protein